MKLESSEYYIDIDILVIYITAMYESAKDFMLDYKKVFGDYEFKARYQNDKGEVVIQSKEWQEFPKTLKEYRAVDLVLPHYLRPVSSKATKQTTKKIVKQMTKYKENV